MKITNLEKREDGGAVMSFDATSEEFSYLLTFAINNLIAMGIIAMDEESMEPQEVEILNKKIKGMH
jgi:hypothetical protein